MVEQCKDTFAVGHCEDTQWLSTAGILCGWALQGYLVVEHCRDTFAVGHCEDTQWLSTAGILCGWALQGYLAVVLGGWLLKSASSRARTTCTSEANNPTAWVGNKFTSLKFQKTIFNRGRPLLQVAT